MPGLVCFLCGAEELFVDVENLPAALRHLGCHLSFVPWGFNFIRVTAVSFTSLLTTHSKLFILGCHGTVSSSKCELKCLKDLHHGLLERNTGSFQGSRVVMIQGFQAQY